MQYVKTSLVPTYGDPKTDQSPSSAAPIEDPAPVAVGVNDSLYVQNLGTNPLFVKRGDNASPTSFHYVLGPGIAQDDGRGGALVIDDFVGNVTFAGTTPRYVAWLR